MKPVGVLETTTLRNTDESRSSDTLSAATSFYRKAFA